MTIRPTTADDIGPLQDVLDATGLFPPELLPDMLRDFLEGAAEGALWLTAEIDGQGSGFCFAAPEPLTNGTWNMRAIAVLPAVQGRRLGAGLVAAMEQALLRQGSRILIVDTSGTEAYARTRRFYHRLGYTEAARIRDFWDAGDDKVVFWKSLA